MNDLPLFNLLPTNGEAQTCDRCSVVVWACFDGLRVLGWLVYDGFSFTGARLRVRICLTCRIGAAAPPTGSTSPAVLPGA